MHMGDILIKNDVLIYKNDVLPAAGCNDNRCVMVNSYVKQYAQIPFLRNAETSTLTRGYQNFVPTEHTPDAGG
jgi:hypothetical protein